MLWWPGHRLIDSVRVCSPASRRVAPLRPRFRGACGLDAGSAHARPDWLLQTMPGPDPLHVVVDDLSKLTRYDQRRVMTSDRQANAVAPDVAGIGATASLT